MFTLFYGFWDYISKKDNYFVLVLGLDSSGKTTFLENIRLTYGKRPRLTQKIDLTRLAPTVGLNVKTIERDGIVINFWDLGGQKELQLLWDKYYLDAHAVVWVIDSCDKERLIESSESFDKVSCNKHLQGLPFLFLLNKQDLPDAIDPKDILEAFEPSLSKLKSSKSFLPIPISALKGTGLKESLSWLCEQVKLSSKPPSDQQ